MKEINYHTCDGGVRVGEGENKTRWGIGEYRTRGGRAERKHENQPAGSFGHDDEQLTLAPAAARNMQRECEDI